MANTVGNLEQPALTSTSEPKPELKVNGHVNNAINAVAKHENGWYNQDFAGYRVTEKPFGTRRAVRIVCVGAGAAGLQLAYKLERKLEDIELQIYEKNVRTSV
jgi:NADH dehydrogenase FAD-containing subunit